MGQVVQMGEVRRARAVAARGSATHRAGRPQVVFAFDLASPETYLMAERVDRGMTGATFLPALRPGARTFDRRAVEARARALRMPLVWPEPGRVGDRAAMRVAHLAAECGHAAAFVLAAGRLAYCGGFALDDPEILAEAAAAAALPLDDCLSAAGDAGRDAAMARDARHLAALGADDVPALIVGTTAFCGERRFAEAAAAARFGRPGWTRSAERG